MARPLRVYWPDGWYHVTSRGNGQQKIYSRDRDRHHFLDLLAGMHESYGVLIHAYVLMTNHYHLQVQTPEVNLSEAMQWLNVSYSTWYNRKYARSGHLFEGRFKAISVEENSWALSLSAYIHLNPVRTIRMGLDKQAVKRKRAGADSSTDPELVKRRLEKLRRYRWSSYPAYVGLSKCPGWLCTEEVLGRVGRMSKVRRCTAYRRYVEDQIREGVEESPWEELKAGVLLGSEEFVERMQSYLHGEEREQPELGRLRLHPSFDRVVEVVEEVKGEKWEAFRDRYGDCGRDVVLYLARKHGRLKLRELGEAVGGLDYGSVSVALRRFRFRLEKDRAAARLLKKAKAELSND